jgi:hypothetical protein
VADGKRKRKIKEKNRKRLRECEMSGSHGSEYKDDSILV